MRFHGHDGTVGIRVAAVGLLVADHLDAPGKRADQRIRALHDTSSATSSRGLSDADHQRAWVEALCSTVHEIGGRPEATGESGRPTRNPLLEISVARVRSRMRDARAEAFAAVVEDPATPREWIPIGRALKMAFAISGSPVDDDEAFARAEETWSVQALAEGAAYNAEHEGASNG